MRARREGRFGEASRAIHVSAACYLPMKLKLNTVRAVKVYASGFSGQSSAGARMATPDLVDASGIAIDEKRLTPFLAAFRGAVIRPGDPEYDSARRIWNASIDKHPGMIARCSGLADVIEAVRFARECGVLVAIRGGGHNVGGRALCDRGLVIDLSRMKGIHVDAKARRARVQPGVLLGELYRETHVFGLTVPAGV